MSGLDDFRTQHPEYNDMSDADLSDALYSRYYSDMPRDQFNTKMGVSATSVVPQDRPTSFGVGVTKGLRLPLDNAAAFLNSGAKRLGIPMDKINSFLGLPDANAVRQGDIQQWNTGKYAPSTLGTMVGGAPAMLATMAVTKNPWAAGMITGLTNTEQDTPTGVGTDAVTGAAFGKAGDAVTRGIGATISPMLRPAVQYLMKKGVQVTPGQMAGGTLHRVEDAATSSMLPFVNDAQRRSLESFNKAVVNQGLDQIGSKLPDAVPAGRPSIAFAQQEFNNAYDNVLPNLTLKKDAQFNTDTTNLRTLAQNLPPEYAKRFNQVMDQQVMNKFSQPGSMSGYTMKEVEEELRHEITNYTGTGATPTDRNYADAVKELQAQVRDLAQRSNPQYADQLQKINMGYAMLARAERAGAPSPNGVFTPAGFRAAVVAGDTSARKRASAAGDSLMMPLADAADQVLPRTIPESGTVPRAIVNGGTAAALFGGGHALAINPLALGAIGLAISPYTKVGGRMLSTIVAPPGAVRQGIRSGLQASAPFLSAETAGSAVRSRDDNLVGVQ